MSMSIKCYMLRDDADADADGKGRLTSFPQVFHRFNRGGATIFKKNIKKLLTIYFRCDILDLGGGEEATTEALTIQKLYAHGRQKSVGFKSIYRANKNGGEKISKHKRKVI